MGNDLIFIFSADLHSRLSHGEVLDPELSHIQHDSPGLVSASLGIFKQSNINTIMQRICIRYTNPNNEQNHICDSWEVN